MSTLKAEHRRRAELEDIDAAYAAVVKRQRGRTVRGVGAAAVLTVVLVGVGALVVDATGGAAEQASAAGPGTVRSSVEAPLPTAEVSEASHGSIRLQASDWSQAVEGRERSALAGAVYEVLDSNGKSVEVGAVGTFGEAIISLPPGSFTVVVARLEDGTECGFSSVVAVEGGRLGVPEQLACAE